MLIRIGADLSSLLINVIRYEASYVVLSNKDFENGLSFNWTFRANALLIYPLLRQLEASFSFNLSAGF